MKKYSDDQKTTFAYWFAHWCCFQVLAFKLKVWRLKYLFHDIEKPWLYLFFNQKKVRQWHRTHCDHHLEYPGDKDWIAMIVDWECSSWSKKDAPLNARQTMYKQIHKYPELEEEITNNVLPLLSKFHL